MENMQYAEELVREFLIFRGFITTLQSFETELSTDIGKSFQVEKILDLIFSNYIPNFKSEKLVDLLGFFKQCLSSSFEMEHFATLSKLEASILRYYIVHAARSGRNDKVLEFFRRLGNELQQKGDDWSPWFVFPYLKNPSTDPQFRIYFSKEWFDALRLSIRNFLSQMFSSNRIPALLKISTEKNTVKYLRRNIKQLNQNLSQLQAVLDEKEAKLQQLKSSDAEHIRQEERSAHNDSVMSSPSMPAKDSFESSTTYRRGIEANVKADDSTASSYLLNMSAQSSDHGSSSSENQPVRGGRTSETHQFSNNGINDGGQAPHVQGEEEFAEVKVQFQETFVGHTSCITRSRFSASGNDIASASADGTVRIWTHDSSMPGSRNATIYCGAEILSLDWDCKSDRLLLIGTAEGGIKAWNVDAKRVVCDLSTGQTFRRVLDVKCSPVEPIFVSAAASQGDGTSYTSGFASLTVWNTKTLKAMTDLPLGEEPPAITSLCFNHNGKILAASAVDGMIHMFDMAAGLQITGWPAHDSPIRSILFGRDETSIFSFGADGKVLEWSLQKQGQILWSANCSRFFDSDATKGYRHEMALDGTGKRLLVTSDLVQSPIYQVGSFTKGMKTLAHNAAITTVDWHPTLPIYLTGSADNSVRVTAIS